MPSLSMLQRPVWHLSMALAVCSLSACASAPAPLETAAEPVLLTLQGRNLTLRVVAGAEDTLFDVLAPNGTPVAETLTKDELGRLYPELKDLVDEALAEGGLDASLTPTKPRSPSSVRSP
jgi:hypothetical protein